MRHKFQKEENLQQPPPVAANVLPILVTTRTAS